MEKSFDPDIIKELQEAYFLLQTSKAKSLNISLVHASQTLRMFLDCKLDFKEHVQNVLNTVSKTIGLLDKFKKISSRPPLITIYNSFIKPYLDYGDIIYDQAYNVSLHQQLESIQYNVTLAITGAIRERSREKLYHELGFESFEARIWFCKLLQNFLDSVSWVFIRRYSYT